jgi:hypothetical protein
MSRRGTGRRQRGPTAEAVRIRVALALGLVELAAQVLEELPSPEPALAAGERDLFRYLEAGESAHGWLVGLEEGASVDHPAPGSALGDGLRILRWSDEETERHFVAALRAWSERQ